MQHWICVTCGTQFASSNEKPDSCPICLDQRQYVGPQGQQWTTLEEMRGSGEYSNTIKQHEPGLVVLSEQGNVLWDCITYLDDETYEAVKELGGISAIAISHPHYYSCMYAAQVHIPDIYQR